jgi:hypothetical protein
MAEIIIKGQKAKRGERMTGGTGWRLDNQRQETGLCRYATPNGQSRQRALGHFQRPQVKECRS